MAGANAGIRLAVFNLMGTTVRDRPDGPVGAAGGTVAEAFRHSLERAGIPVSGGRLSAVRGLSKREAVRRLVKEHLQPSPADPRAGAGIRFPAYGEPARPERERAELDGLCDRVYADFQDILPELWRSSGVETIPGAVEALEELRCRGVRTALNTGLDRRLTLALLGMLPALERAAVVVACGDQVARGRPAPDLIRRCMAGAGVDDPALVMNVGDTVADMEAGAVAGVGVNVAVASGAHGRERLLRSPCTHLLHSAAGVPALLDGISRQREKV